MESHEVLRQAIEPIGAKKAAHELRVSSSLVYKWCEEDSSGARNPLDRIQALVQCTGSRKPVEWLCRQAGGYFVADPQVELAGFDAEFIAHTQRMLANFSELLQVISSSMTDDGKVDQDEAKRIRQEWEELKGYAESFVVACEQGMFDTRD
jgi:hypothetical protein